MGLYRDIYQDGLFEQDHPFGMPGEIWSSKNGKIRVRDMTEQHIMNCMKIVGEDDVWYWYFKKELERRGVKNAEIH